MKNEANPPQPAMGVAPAAKKPNGAPAKKPGAPSNPKGKPSQ